MPVSKTTDTVATAAAGGVLMTLAASQFLMTLDSSVMNVSMATVANDVGTTITGIQTAITLYTLVMATLMITGGKIGSLIGRRRAFALGCVIYGLGSLTTALAPTLTVLIIGWSVLEGLEHDEFAKGRVQATTDELLGERDDVKALGLIG